MADTQKATTAVTATTKSAKDAKGGISDSAAMEARIHVLEVAVAGLRTTVEELVKDVQNLTDVVLDTRKTAASASHVETLQEETGGLRAAVDEIVDTLQHRVFPQSSTSSVAATLGDLTSDIAGDFLVDVLQGEGDDSDIPARAPTGPQYGVGAAPSKLKAFTKTPREDSVVIAHRQEAEEEAPEDFPDIETITGGSGAGGGGHPRPAGPIFPMGPASGIRPARATDQTLAGTDPALLSTAGAGKSRLLLPTNFDFSLSDFESDIDDDIDGDDDNDSGF